MRRRVCVLASLLAFVALDAGAPRVAEASIPNHALRPRPVAPTATPSRVLVVSDRGRVLSRRMARAGHTVEVVSLVAEARGSYDVVVVDTETEMQQAKRAYPLAIVYWRQNSNTRDAARAVEALLANRPTSRRRP